MNCIKYIFTLSLITGSLALSAQQGKDGSKTISATSIVNEYIDLTTNIDSGDVTIKVSASTLNANGRFSAPLAAGDLIFIYQTRGATIRGIIAGWGGNGNPRDSSMGEILNYNNTGHYQFAEVKNVPDGTTIEVSCPINKDFTSGLGRTQVIRVPRYSSLTINSPGILTAQAWNGTTGGVLVTEVKGNTTINAGGKMEVSGLGFRGGVTVNISEVSANNEGTDNNAWGADKGEGIGGYQAEYNSVLWNGNDGGGRYGKNSMANGGGGGCSIDGGGGGGANGGNANPLVWNGRGVPDLTGASYALAWAKENPWVPLLTSPGGGKGGYKYANTAQDPMLVAPGNASWGGDKRGKDGGLGGRPLDYSTGSIFLGGGGGAGQGDNNYAGSGGNGGGLIYLLCFGSVSGTGQIISNGNDGVTAQGTPSNTVLTGKDGAGGGGGGGTIIINSAVSGISAFANGGKGGNQNMVHGIFSGGWEAQGPGGGGGGGYIAVKSGAITQQVNGGANGTSNSQIVNSVAGHFFPPNGATAGGAGSMNQVVSDYRISVRDTAICGGGSSVTLSASLTGTIPAGVALTWYDAAIAGNIVGSGTTYTTPVLATTTTYYVGSCPGYYRVPITVTVGAPFSCTLTATNATCVSGGSVTTALSGGTAVFTYSWSNGATSATLSNVAAATYTVTVTDAGGCTATSTATVNGASSINVSSNTATNLTCAGQSTGSIAMNPSGGSTPYTYSWSNGATAQTINTLSAGSYTVTVRDASGCSVSSTVTITQPAAITTPTFTPVNATCGLSNGSAVASSSGGTGTLTYTWSNSASGQTMSAVSAGSYTVTVRDANACTKTAIAIIGSTSGGTVSVTVQSNVSCNGGSNGSVSANPSGGTPNYTYSWSNAATGQTISGLAAGPYTVTMTDASGCTAVNTFTLTAPAILLTPTFTPTNAKCGINNGTAIASSSGGSGTLTYTWSNGATGQTATGLAATTYTVTVTDANSCTKSAVVSIGATAGGTATATIQSNLSCNGGSNGSAVVSATGGTPNYTYSWSNAATGQTITGLIAGPYSVTMTDASGCTSSSSVTITAPPAIATPTVTPVNATCGSNNGSATASSSGGTGTLTYTWSNAATGQTINALSAGSYIVTVKDANACTKSAIANISSAGGASATISAQSNIICNGGNNGSVTVNASGGTPNYTYSWSNGSSGVTVITGLTAGTYVVSVTDAAGCTTITSVNITEPTAIATLTFSLTPASCGVSNGSATASSSGGTGTLTYIWSNGSTTQTINALSAGSYIVTVKDANACTRSAIATISNASGGTATATIQSNISCNGGNNGSVTAAMSGGTPNYTYSWSNGTTGTSTITGLTTGAYFVSIIDASGCVATDSIYITEPAVVTIQPIAVTPASCGGINGTATASSSGGTGTLTYTWSNGITGQTITGLSAGSYILTVLDANACTKSATALIGSTSGGTAGATIQSNVSCNGGNDGSIIATATGGTPNYTYSWSNSATGQSVSGLTAGSYSVTVTDASGCTAVSNVSITAPAAITTSAFITTPANCGTSNGTVSANVSGGAGSFSFTWSNGASGQTITGLSAGSYTLTVIDANTCTNTSVAVIASSGGATVNATIQSNVSCSGGNNGSALVNASGGTPNYTYSWSNGISGATAITGLTAGNYFVSVTDASGCTNIASVNITEPAAIALPSFTTTPSNCSANNGTATATTTGGTGSLTYSWSNGIAGQTISGLTAGTYTITVIDANACSVSAATTVSSAGGGTATTTIQSNASCNGGNNGSISVNITGGTPNYTYSWSNGASTGSATATGLTAGTYSVTVADASGCISISTATLTEPSALLITSNTSAACGSNNGTATVTVSGGIPLYSFNWSPIGGNAPAASGLSSGTYTCIVTDANGCTTTSSISVTAKPAPTVNAGANTSINSGSSYTLTPTTGSLSPTYQWSPSDGLSCTTCENPVASPAIKTIYCVQVTDTNGCSNTSCVTVDVNCGTIYTPSAFSPDGDNQNEVYYVRGGCIKTLHFTIFNRWGEKVFETTNQSTGWDGTYKGEACSSDVYTYYLNATLFDDSVVSRKGNITLVK